MADITIHFINEERQPVLLLGVKVVRFEVDSRVVVEQMGSATVWYERDGIDYLDVHDVADSGWRRDRYGGLHRTIVHETK